ncbi:molybdopterin synthase catalytic subunit MoaE [uncultured Oxalicibacterium sp.]|uniref:molybdopterin synthase catalytic subunit MoaE n=1 Tax=uncultured Oxalicibacterium sp. TaxID=1168540 RepID=UPI0025F62B78|nr:molybdopterin synthase catalytic subunit MoaE [uncultured Oxalicibacterium sp.]
MPVRVQTEDFDVSAEVAALRADCPQIGAVVTFIGTVRDMNEGSNVAAMELEHYPGMTEKALQNIVDEAKQRWQLGDALVIHRVGPLLPKDQIVLVAVTSAHRGEAFDACEFIIDYLKTDAPFWKKEQTPQGARWVDARVTDDEALKKWHIDLALQGGEK